MAVLCVLFAGLPSAAAQKAAAAPLPQAPAPASDASGSISGVIVDTHGALVSGATIQISPANGAPSERTTSASDGAFAFDHVSPGSFTLFVTLQGFVSASSTGALNPGQSLQLTPIALQIATAVFEVNVVPDPQTPAEHQLLLEEKQRLLGFAPNFFVTYDWTAPPLTSRQKFALAWANGRDPGNLLLSGAVAGVQQADDAFSGYHQGAAGYGKRFGADLANLEIGTFLGGAILPSLFHQDPRYFYKGTGTIRSRILYALGSAVICRGDDGRSQPAFASVLGDLSAGAISNLYYPASNRNGPGLTL